MADRPFESVVEPELGGEVRVMVDGWAGWHVWIDVTGYEDRAPTGDIPLDPRQAVRAAINLLKAAAVCWWHDRKGRGRG